MASDLVERLRNHDIYSQNFHWEVDPMKAETLCDQAADEIVRLREALGGPADQAIYKSTGWQGDMDPPKAGPHVARQALSKPTLVWTEKGLEER